MIRAVVPHMRKQRSGRIINISSIAGKLPTPANGTHSATKFALESLSDALHLELAPFGNQVVLVEPGAIKTHFDDTAQAHARDILLNSDSPYQPLYKQSAQFAVSMRQDEPGPEVVFQVIERAIKAFSPKACYLAGISLSGRLVVHLRDFLWGLIVRQMFKIKSMETQS
jgi:short-subunit dehydrogenase